MTDDHPLGGGKKVSQIIWKKKTMERPWKIGSKKVTKSFKYSDATAAAGIGGGGCGSQYRLKRPNVSGLILCVAHWVLIIDIVCGFWTLPDFSELYQIFS